MLSLILSVVLLSFGWVVASIWASIRFPDTRGSLRARSASLWGGRDVATPMSLDVSRDAAARLLSFRVGGFLRGAAYLVFDILVLARAPAVLDILFLLVFPLVQRRSVTRVPWFVYSALTGRTTFAYSDVNELHQYPDYKRGLVRTAGRVATSNVLLTIGIPLVYAASLNIAYNSKSLVTPIPGLYWRHVPLRPWQLGLIIEALGWLLVLKQAISAVRGGFAGRDRLVGVSA
jgi:hypothetical protein